MKPIMFADKVQALRKADAKVRDLRLGKKERQEALNKVRALEAFLGLDGESYNGRK